MKRTIAEQYRGALEGNVTADDLLEGEIPENITELIPRIEAASELIDHMRYFADGSAYNHRLNEAYRRYPKPRS